MAISLKTQYCYPIQFPIKSLADPEAVGFLEAKHEECPGSVLFPGMIGGWICPCPCHKEEIDEPY